MALTTENQDGTRQVSGKKGERQIFLDILRILSCAAVVLMHTVSGVLDGDFDMTGYERRQCAFRAVVDACAFCVPVFLMISGYLLLDPKRRITWRTALLVYCRRVFLALLLFGIPFSLLELLGRERGFRWGMLFEAVRNTLVMRSWAHMWYLYLILFLYAVTPALKWGLERAPLGVVYGILAAVFLLCSLLPFAEAAFHLPVHIGMPREGIYFFYYIMGYVFVRREKPLMKWEGPLCLTGFGLLLCLQMGIRFLPGYENDLAYAYPPTLLAALLLFAGSRAIEWKRGTYVKRISELTFGIYLIHPVFLNFFYKFCGISIMNFRFFVGVPMFFAAALLGAALATLVLRMIPFFRKYVL